MHMDKKIYHSVHPKRKKDVNIQIGWFKVVWHIYISGVCPELELQKRQVPVEGKLIQGEIIACVTLSESMFPSKERNSC